MLNGLIRLLLAPRCVICDHPLIHPLDGPVCVDCWRAVPRLTPPCCPRCGDALASWRTGFDVCVRCRRRPTLLEAARSAGRYEGSLRRIIHEFKYRRLRVLAGPLAGRLVDAGAEVLAGAEAVVPVPLHPWRRMRRGFNQADDLARGLPLPVWRVLRRRELGRPQAQLPAARRHANVRNAFALVRHPLGAHPRDGPFLGPPHLLIRNRTLVLIDDVMTTGATMEACGRVLLEAGATAVRALSVARAVAGPGPPRHG